MIVIKPTTITDAMFVSSTAPETDYTAWNAATAYIVGDKVIRTSTHRIYYRLIAGTTATAPESDGVNWSDIAPTNRWALFDGQVSTLTTLASPLTTVIKPGIVNAISLFGLVGTSLTVSMKDGLAGPTVYTSTTSLDGTIVFDFYSYCFEPFVQRGEVVLQSLPAYSDGHITVTVTGTGSVGCGVLSTGIGYDLGGTLQGATAGLVDFSIKSTDSFGVTSFVERSYSKRMSAKSMIENSALNRVQTVLASVRATPCTWVGTNASNYEPLIVFGFCKDWSIDISYPDYSFVSFEIEGLA